MTATSSPSSSPSRPRRRSLRWVWFFAVLAVLAVAALVIPIIYNLDHDRQRGFTVTDQGVVVIAKAELPETFAQR